MSRFQNAYEQFLKRQAREERIKKRSEPKKPKIPKKKPYQRKIIIEGLVKDEPKPKPKPKKRTKIKELEQLSKQVEREVYKQQRIKKEIRDINKKTFQDFYKEEGYLKNYKKSSSAFEDIKNKGKLKDISGSSLSKYKNITHIENNKPKGVVYYTKYNKQIKIPFIVAERGYGSGLFNNLRANNPNVKKYKVDAIDENAVKFFKKQNFIEVGKTKDGLVEMELNL